MAKEAKPKSSDQWYAEAEADFTSAVFKLKSSMSKRNAHIEVGTADFYKSGIDADT